MPKFQACMYKPVSTGQKSTGWRKGLASVNNFGVEVINFIVDAETGERFEEVYNYYLLSGPVKYLDFETV